MHCEGLWLETFVLKELMRFLFYSYGCNWEIVKIFRNCHVLRVCEEDICKLYGFDSKKSKLSYFRFMV